MTQNIDPEDLRVRFAAATTALRGTAYRTAPAADEPAMRVIANLAEKFAHSAIASAFGGSVNDHTGPMLTAPSAPTDDDIVLFEWIRWAACRIYDAENELKAERAKAEMLRESLTKQSDISNANAMTVFHEREARDKAVEKAAALETEVAQLKNDRAELTIRLEIALESLATIRMGPQIKRALERAIASAERVPTTSSKPAKKKRRSKGRAFGA